MFSLRLGNPFNWGWPRRPSSSGARRQQKRPAASSSAGAGGLQSYSQRVSGWQGAAKSGAISGGLSALGDVLAQFVSAKEAEGRGDKAAAYDVSRSLRMLGFGLLWYGPYQYYWYNLLDWAMPARNTHNFLSKVVLNQVALAPVVLAVVFAWNQALTGQAAGIPDKIKRDLVPSMMNGWKFWVPAASINFYCIPVDKQVLYMSSCGLLWAAYLSYASAKAPPPPPPKEEPKKGFKLPFKLTGDLPFIKRA